MKKEFRISEASFFQEQLERHLFKRVDQKKVNFSSQAVNIKSKDDHSFMFWDNALAVNYRGYWFIFTEHYNKILFHEDEVDVAIYDRLYQDSDPLKEFIALYETSE